MLYSSGWRLEELKMLKWCGNFPYRDITSWGHLPCLISLVYFSCWSSFIGATTDWLQFFKHLFFHANFRIVKALEYFLTKWKADFSFKVSRRNYLQPIHYTTSVCENVLSTGSVGQGKKKRPLIFQYLLKNGYNQRRTTQFWKIRKPIYVSPPHEGNTL